MRQVFRSPARLAVIASALVFAGCSLQLKLDPQKQAAVPQESTPASGGSTVAALNRLLDSPDPQVRSLAAKEVGEIGPQAAEVVPTLHRLVDDPDARVRARAARALAQIAPEDRVTVPALVQVAKDERALPAEREQARELLGQIGPRGQSALLEMTATTQPATTAKIEIEQTVISRPLKAVERSEVVEPPREDVTPEVTIANPIAETRTSSQLPTDEKRNVPASPVIQARSEEVRARVDKAVAPTTVPSPMNDPATRAAISGVSDLQASPVDPYPKPDINVHGYTSYTSAQSLKIKDWLDRQPRLTKEQREQRYRQFQAWRQEQEKKIYQKVMEK